MAPRSSLTQCTYNMAAISFTPAELANEINKTVHVAMTYQPDFRQQIADSWPQSLDDRHARADWVR